MKLNEKYWTIIIFVICLAYILLRFWHLTDSCLWFDEIFSVHAAEMDWQNLFKFVVRDLIHPPLFYIFLKIWISIGGDSLFWLRFFPVLFSVLALFPFLLLCRQLKLKTSAIAFAFVIFAVNGNLIKYAQEVRMYSVLLCLSLFSLWIFVRYLNVGKGVWWLTTVNVLLVHTQYFGWFLIFAEVLTLLYLQRVKIGQILTMFGLTAAGFIPWTIVVWRAARTNANVSQNLSWASKPDLLTLIRFFFNLNEPFYFQTSSIDPLTIWQITPLLVMTTFTAILFYFANWRDYDEKEKNAVIFLLITIFTPLLLAFTASWIFPFSIWGTRHFIIIFAPYSILLAKIFTHIQIKALQICLITAVLIIITGGFILYFNRAVQPQIWCAWENFAGQIPNQTVGEPTKVYVFEDLNAYQFWFAARNNPGVNVIKINNLAGISEDKAYFLPRGFDAVKQIDFDQITDDKFYIAFRDVNWNLEKPPLKDLIEKGYQIGAPQIYEAQGLKAFLVEIHK